MDSVPKESAKTRLMYKDGKAIIVEGAPIVHRSFVLVCWRCGDHTDMPEKFPQLLLSQKV